MNDRRDSLIVSAAGLPMERARVMWRWLPAGLNVEDAADAGQLALVNAPNHWREDGGTPFHQYARVAIDNAIRSLVRHERREARSRGRIDEVDPDAVAVSSLRRPYDDLFPVLFPDLSRTERMIVRLHYEDGMRLADVARVVGIARSGVTEIHQRMLDRLRHDPRVIAAAAKV